MLLPAEAELCNTLGLSEEEYWYFVELTESYNGQRKEEYALVPDVRNGPTVAIIVNLVIGIALQAVAYLLAPKPRSQGQTPPQRRTEDVRGRSKFAPQDDFNAVQELAALGSVIPLIFTRRGVRVSGQLLWSQLLSEGNTQQLKTIILFSLGQLERAPAVEGFAIGDMMLKSYTQFKAALYFKPNGGRINETDRTWGQLAAAANDVFSIYWDSNQSYQPYFSGTRNPSTQVQFGVYQPVPNGMMWRPNYELILKPEDAGDALQEDIDRKQDKVYRGKFPLRCYVSSANSQQVTYTIDSYLDSGKSGYGPWGTEDVRSAQESAKSDADAALQVGELYMVGNDIAVCTGVSLDRPWEEGVTKYYTFTWEGNKRYAEVMPFSEIKPPYEVLTIMRCAVATISNSRDCDVTELGLKSVVWKQINGFANVNSYPSQSTIRNYEKKNGSFTLGSVNKYIVRLSFFHLEVRPIGSTDYWVDISGGTLFCVKGQTPQAQYNFLRITQPYGQYEYRLIPEPGNFAWQQRRGRDVWLLEPGSLLSYEASGFKVTFAGRRFRLTDDAMSNAEWYLGSPTAGAPIADKSLNPFDAVSDYVLYEAETASHFNEPEHEVVYVNEQRTQAAPQYPSLAIAGLRLRASKEWSSFSQLSAWFERGIVVERLVEAGRSATNLLPEIAYALLTDPVLGAGKLIGANQVNRERMELAAWFCQSNGFYWDGVIDQRQNLRQWIYEQAGYCLLDFTILGGQFSLVPSVPYNSDGMIDFSGKPEIKALFTDGNVRNMQVTFLSPEERQLFRATALWREERRNGFPQTRTFSIRLSDALGGSDADPEETFDMSGFCTNYEHAEKFVKYALKIRQLVDHGIKFQTTPQAAMSLAPGEYFRFVSEATHTSRFNNGSIGTDGTIQSVDVLSGTYPILYWVPGTTGVQTGTLTASNGRTNQSALYGTVFTITSQSTTDRVYKVETLSYAEDGLVDVTGSHTPLLSDGRLAVLNWPNNDFVVTSG